MVARGERLGYPELAMAAQVGRARVVVTRRPRIAILSTGDELVSIEQSPGPFQIRNSNSISLAAQVALAGGEPVMLGSAPDELAELRTLIGQGVEADILVLTGGVSVGKYDLVEQVLREFGAEFFFDAIAIRPGKPAVFGWCHEKPTFGLPGNPVSTMVTFELLVVPAIELMSGHKPDPLPFYRAKLAHPIEQKAKLDAFSACGGHLAKRRAHSRAAATGKARATSARWCAEIAISSFTIQILSLPRAIGWMCCRGAEYSSWMRGLS